MKRVIKFKAFIDLKLFKVMIDEVELSVDSNCCGCTIEQFEEAIKLLGWEIDDEYHLLNNQTGQRIDMYDSGAHGTGNDFVWFDNCEVMQYIGLNDKNGKEAYCEDIYIDDKGNLWILCQDNLGVWAELLVDRNQWVRDFTPELWSKDCEIVGNSFEHPHLLK